MKRAIDVLVSGIRRFIRTGLKDVSSLSLEKGTKGPFGIMGKGTVT